MHFVLYIYIFAFVSIFANISAQDINYKSKSKLSHLMEHMFVKRKTICNEQGCYNPGPKAHISCGFGLLYCSTCPSPDDEGTLCIISIN